MDDDFTLDDLPRLLREYALTDVKWMIPLLMRTRVEMAAADEIERLRHLVESLSTHGC